MKRIYSVLAFYLIVKLACSQPFVFIDTPLEEVMQSTVQWVDYNLDGRIDLFISGHIYSGNELQIKGGLYRNNASSQWEKINTGIEPLTYAMLDWADMDGDNDPDLLICGQNKSGLNVCKIYRNNGNGSFTEVKNSLPAITEGSVQWGDYDLDGRQDILICGKTSDDVLISKVFRNTGSTFEDISAGLLPVHKGLAHWEDLNNDGYPEILLLGSSYNNDNIGKIYINRGGSFVESNIHLPKLKNAAAACADLNGDDLTDLVIAGENPDGILLTIVLRNNGGGSFSPADVKLPGIRAGTIDAADFDADGDMDLVLCGEADNGAACFVMRNKGGFRFENIGAALPGVSPGGAWWGDYDGDKDQDLLISGLNNCFDFTTKLFRNDGNYKTDTDLVAVSSKKEDGGRRMWTSSEINIPGNKYYYFVYASCYCDPFTEGDIKTHAFISNVHYAPEKYSLIENFNRIIRENSEDWAAIDKGNRVSTGYYTSAEAEEARQRVLQEYKKEGFIVHFVEW